MIANRTETGSPRPDRPGRHTKVIRFRILKPANDMTWPDLAKLLRDARYRVFRLANLAVSEHYLAFHLWRTGNSESLQTETIGKLNARLRAMIDDEETERSENYNAVDNSHSSRFSRTGALPDTVVSALSRYTIRGLTRSAKWRDITRGNTSLPTFRNTMAIPVRCDKPDQKRLERADNGNVELDLMICLQPYPRVVLQTGDLGGSARAILDRLLANPDQSEDGYCQRLFEIRQDQRTNKWWLHVTYSFPAASRRALKPDVVVGVDLGYSCPLYAAINNGHARLGYRAFKPLGNAMKSLQRQVMARRRDIQRGGAQMFSRPTARAGHGVQRKLLPIEKLEGRINRAYNTLNHQLSAAVVQFALNHGAGVIQMEDLDGLKDHLRGTFIGASWRYHQLQEFLTYKAAENGITVRKVNPRYTSRRCSRCGTINIKFDRAARDTDARPGFSARFQCIDPDCEYARKPVDADYNAARNLATLDIVDIIRLQCTRQELKYADQPDGGVPAHTAETGPKPAL